MYISVQDSSTVPGWSLSTRRSHILRILEQVLSVLGDMEDSWIAWQQASAQMEAHLQSHLVGNQDQYRAFSQVQPVATEFVSPIRMHQPAMSVWQTKLG